MDLNIEMLYFREQCSNIVLNGHRNKLTQSFYISVYILVISQPLLRKLLFAVDDNLCRDQQPVKVLRLKDYQRFSYTWNIFITPSPIMIQSQPRKYKSQREWIPAVHDSTIVHMPLYWLILHSEDLYKTESTKIPACIGRHS